MQLPPWLVFFGTGVVFGLAGGLTPGPTTALVISQTLRHDVREGFKVAISPLLTDAPIVAAAVLLFSRVDADPLLGAIGAIGAAVLVWLSVECFRARPPAARASDAAPRSLLKGFLANLFNPHPYVFWLAIGAPTFVRALEDGPLPPAAFLVAHYLCLVGSKLGLALLVERGRGWLNRFYLATLRVLGVVLLVFALLFLRDALRHLGGL